ncbi:MAG: hypothetical protein ACRCTA_02160, partial [Bacilli bacterium]
MINYTITDTSLDWSNALTLKNVVVPQMSYATTSYFTYHVYFLKDGNVIQSFLNRSTSSSKTYNAPTGANGYKIVVPTLQKTDNTAALGEIIIAFGYDKTKLEEQRCLFNRASFEYQLEGITTNVLKSSGCDLVLDEGVSRLALSKRILNQKAIYQYEDTINFQLNYSNSIMSGKAAKGVVFYDLLPKGVKFIPGSSVGANIEFLEVIDNYKGTNQQRLKWRYINDLIPGASGSFTFDAFVSEDVANGVNINRAYLLADTKIDNNFDYIDYPKDVNDIDDDSNVTEGILEASASFDNVAYSGLLIIKEVKGDQDSEYSRYPLSGNVSAGGQFQYRIRIKNLSNSDLRDIKIIDILPYINDRGVIVATPRLSQWTPFLKAGISDTNGFTFKYSTSTNPDRSLIGRPGLGEVQTIWTSLPNDITSVRSILIEHNGVIPKGGVEKVFTFNMVSPYGAPNNGEIAWNSVAVQAKTTSGSSQLTTPTEPKKVGIKTKKPINLSISGFTFLD